MGEAVADYTNMNMESQSNQAASHLGTQFQAKVYHQNKYPHTRSPSTVKTVCLQNSIITQTTRTK